MDPPKALLDRISVRASSGSDYTFGYGHDRLPDNVPCAPRRDEQTETASAAPGRSPRSAPAAPRRRVRRCRSRHLFATELRDLDQSLYTVREASERPVRHDARDGGVDGLTGLRFVHIPVPRCRRPVRLIDREMGWRSRSTPMTTTFTTVPTDARGRRLYRHRRTDRTTPPRQRCH